MNRASVGLLARAECQDLQSQLNRLGESGWECIAFTPDTWKGGVNSYTVVTYHAIFKRRRS